ncbi:hypothetical protein [Rhodobacter sp. CZR27]|uniref:hypothetical protein n=1 Tax=Rhodobacter sp. CZR27 TaxID=2033869 RepID=UPI001E575F28|nr:hypothetical protein [Rhodobacter sp. CZR27]
MTASLPPPPFGPAGVAVCGDRATRLGLCGDLAGALNEAMERLARLEADLGKDIAPFAMPLRQSLTDLCALVDQAVSLLTEEAMTEPASPPACIDEDRFSRLLEIAGPDTADELVDRLHLDLKHTRERLDEAMAAADWAEVRAQTHVLVSLAGTVGASELQRMAEALNGAAHLRDHDSAQAIRSELLGRLDGLLAFVARQRGSA